MKQKSAGLAGLQRTRDRVHARLGDEARRIGREHGEPICAFRLGPVEREAPGGA